MLKRKKNGPTENLIRNLKDLNNQKIEVGHFAAQGSVTSNPNISYPDLLQIWHLGAAQGSYGVVKSPLYAFINSYLNSGEFSRDVVIRRVFKDWAKVSTTPNTSSSLLSNLGEALMNEYYKVYGRVGQLMPASSRGKAMDWTGELKSKVSFRTSKSPIIKEHG